MSPRKRLVVIGNGMAGARLVEELAAPLDVVRRVVRVRIEADDHVVMFLVDRKHVAEVERLFQVDAALD